MAAIFGFSAAETTFQVRRLSHLVYGAANLPVKLHYSLVKRLNLLRLMLDPHAMTPTFCPESRSRNSPQTAAVVAAQAGSAMIFNPS